MLKRTIRLCALVSLLLVLVVSVVAVAANMEIILWGDHVTMEIDGSHPSYATVGWAEYKDAWQSLGYRNYRSYIEGEEIERMLSIDDDFVDASSLVTRYDPRNPDYGAIWTATWTFRFRPGELPQGDPLFRTWIRYNGILFCNSRTWITVVYP